MVSGSMSGPLRALSDYTDPAATPEERRRRREEAHLALQSKLSVLRSLHLVQTEKRRDLPQAATFISRDGTPAGYAKRIEERLTALAARHAAVQRQLLAERDAARATARAIGAAAGALVQRLASVEPEMEALRRERDASERKALRLADHVRELQEKVRSFAGAPVAGASDRRLSPGDDRTVMRRGSDSAAAMEADAARVAKLAGMRRLSSPAEFDFLVEAQEAAEAAEAEAQGRPKPARNKSVAVASAALTTAQVAMAGREDAVAILSAAEEKAAADLRLRVAQARANAEQRRPTNLLKAAGGAVRATVRLDAPDGRTTGARSSTLPRTSSYETRSSSASPSPKPAARKSVVQQARERADAEDAAAASAGVMQPSRRTLVQPRS